jgi:glycosyltransferase involved in cell wall biosynthesis
MNIGYFTDVYDPECNGVVFSLHQFEDELEKRGNLVYVFAPKNRRGFKDTRPRVTRFPSIPSFMYPGIRLAMPGLPTLVTKIKKYNLDIIHSHTPVLGPWAEFVSLRLGIPHVHTYHTMIDEYVAIYVPGVKKWNKKVMSRITKTFLNRTDYVVAPSQKVCKSLKKLGVTTPIEIIPTGVQLEEFTDIPAGKFRAAHKIKADVPIVLYIGRVAEEKNLNQLLKAFPLIKKKRPDAVLVIGGDGPYLDELKKQAQKLKIADSTIFAGYLKRDGVAELMRDSSVFVFPSLSDTQGLVLLEAAAAGLPLVACEGDIAPYLEPGRNGLLSKNSPKDLSTKVDDILKDPAICARMGRSSLVIARDYTAEKQADKMLNLYKRLTLSE